MHARQAKLAAVATCAGAATLLSVTASAQAVQPTGNIRQGPCDAAHATWVHLTRQGHAEECWGFQGTQGFPRNTLTQFCSGNNWGHLVVLDESNNHISSINYGEFSFSPWRRSGITHADLISLTISGWGPGSTEC